MTGPEIEAHLLAAEWLAAQGDGVTGGRACFLQAWPEAALVVQAKAGAEGTVFVQTWKPFFDGLQRAGVQVVENLEGDFDLIVLFARPQRIETLGWIGRALAHLKKEGRFVFCCPNELGAKGYQRHLREAFGAMEIVTERKCRLVATRKDQVKDPALLEEWDRALAPFPIEGTGLISQAGLFSWSKIDEASAFLAEQLPEGIEGEGIDLGCGNGYLTLELLKKNGGVKGATLIDAESRALSCAQRNLRGFAEKSLHFQWADVIGLSIGRRFRWCLLNPPFHAGKREDHELGVAFIDKAAELLEPGGTLYLVANKFLPYEHALRKSFASHDRVAEATGWKVIFARK